MNTAKAVMAYTKLELSESFNKRHALNVTNSSSQLNDADFWLISILSYRYFGNIFNPVLNGISNVWDNYL